MALAGGLWAPIAHADSTPAAGPASTTQTPSETAAASQARKTGATVEVPDEGNETSTVVANPDGTFTMSSHMRPIRVKRGNAWIPVDTSLKPTADGLLAPVAATEDVKFSNGGNASLATISTQGKSVSFSWPAPLPTPRVSGSTAVYPSILPGVDLQITAGADDYSEVLIVHDAAAAANPALKSIKLKASTSGLTLSADHNGLSARDAGGTEVLHGAAPIMWDSTNAPDVGPAPTATSPGSGHVSNLSLTQAPASAPSTSDLTLTPDPAALAGPGVVYPLYIDPQMSGQVQHTLVVSSSGPRESIFDTSNFPQQVGYCGDTSQCNGIGVARSYFQLDTSPLLKRNGWAATIHSAYFYATQYHQFAHCVSEPVDLHHAGATLQKGTTFPGPLGAFISRSSSSASNTCSTSPPAPVQFAAGPAAVEAANNDWGSIALALTAPDETNGDQWKTFNTNDAHLDVTFNYPPNSPTGLHVAHAVNCNGMPTTPDANPTLYASATDNNASPLPLGLQFEVWNRDATQWIVSNQNLVGIASGTEGAWTTSSALPENQYAYRVQATNEPADGADWLQSRWSDWFSFIARTGPFDQIPTATSFDYPQGYWGAPQGTPATFTLQANGAPNMVGFTYTFDGAGTEAIPSTTDCDYNKVFDTHGGWIATTSGTATLTIPSGLSPGYHTLHLRSFDDAHRLSTESPAYTFYVSPNVGVTKTKLEAELNTDVTPSQPTGQNIPMTTQQGGDFYSNGWQLFFPGNAAKQTFDLTFNAPVEADYALGAEMTKAPDYGQVQVALDGKPLAGTDTTAFDGYAPTVARSYLPLNGAHLTKGSHTLTFTLTGTNAASTGNRYQVGIDYLTVAPLNNVIADNFTDAMNNHGIGPDGSAVNLDFSSAGLSSQSLATAGLAPGASITVGGATFTMPAANTSTGNDNVVAVGQTIPFPAYQQVKASAVGLLAMSTCGNTPAAPGAVTYKDDAHTYSNPWFPSVADWINSPADGAAVVLDHWSGRRAVKPKVFAIFVPTDPTKPLASITLPNIGTSFRSGVCDNALHVLAIGARPAQNDWLGAWAAPADRAVPAPVGGNANTTMRMVVHPTVSGVNARVRLSNSGVPTLTTLDHVVLARQAGTGAATANPELLTFCAALGKDPGCAISTVTIPAGGEVYSDPTALPTGIGDLAVSVHVPQALAWIPVHAGSSSPAYAAAGDVSDSTDGTGFTSTQNTASFVTAVDISPVGTSQGTVAVLGDQRSAASAGAGTWVDKMPAKLGSKLPGSIVNDSKAGVPATARWKLDEGSGTIAQDSVGTNTGTLSGGVTWSSDHGGSAVFNGVDGKITTAGPVLDTTGSYSVSAWVYLKGIGNYMTAVGDGGQNAASSYLQYSEHFNAWTFISPSSDSSNPDSFPAAHAATAPDLNRWTHLLGVFDATSGTMKLYVNGALAATAINPSPWKATWQLTIGAVTLAQGGSSNFFNGSISDVRVYQQALTATDAGLLYRGDAPTGPLGGIGALSASNAGTTLNQTAVDEPNLRTVIVNLGANDILAGDSATTVKANLTKLIKATGADGIKQLNRSDGSGPVLVILTTIPPLGLNSDDPREQQRQLLNSDIRQSLGDTGADYLVDFDLAVRDTSNGNQVAAQYLTNGSLNDNYYDALAQRLADAVKAFPPQAKL